MNKVVILSFIIVAGAVLIGVPLYGSFNPRVMPEYEKMQAEAKANAATTDRDTLVANYQGSTWTASQDVMLDTGYGQGVPAVFYFEMTLAPEGKLKCKAHIFSDVALAPKYEAIKPVIEAGWEGTWRVRSNGSFVQVSVDNPFRGLKGLEDVYPLATENLQIDGGDTLSYNAKNHKYVEFKRMI